MSFASRNRQYVKRYDPADHAALLEFQRQMFGEGSRHLDPRRFEWLFRENPVREEAFPLWIFAKDGRIVGEQAVIPFMLSIDGRRHPAAWPIDLMVDPAWRLRGVAPAIMETSTTSHPIMVGLNIAGPLVTGLVRTGWVSLGVLPAYHRVVAFSGVLHVQPTEPRAIAMACKAADKALDVLGLAWKAVGHLRHVDFVRVDAFDARVDALWERVRLAYAVIACRDFATLHWRFDRIPEADAYERLYLVDTKTAALEGYAVVRTSDDETERTGIIVDLLAKPEALTMLLAACIEYLAKSKIARVVVIANLPLSDAQMAALGFIRRDSTTSMLVRVDASLPGIAERLVRRENWFTTLADSDTDHGPARTDAMVRRAPAGSRVHRVRICELTPSLNSGGIETRIARVLRGLDPAAFHAAWAGLTPLHPTLAERAGPGVAFTSLVRARDGMDVDIIRQLAVRLRRDPAHVLHVHNWSTSFYGIAAGILGGVPSIVYGVGGRDSSDTNDSPKRRAARFAMAPHIRAFTTVCNFLADEVAEEWHIERSRVHVIRTGVDVERFRTGASRDVARERLGIAKDAIVLGTVAVPRPVKRLDNLIRAGILAAESRPNLHIVIVGDASPAEQAPLRALLEGATHAPTLHFFGRCEDVHNLVQAFDCYVNCSRFEGASNSIIEAMAAGLPIIATRTGGSPELVLDGVNGLLVPREDVDALAAAFSRMISSPVMRAEFGARSSDVANREHTHERMIAEYSNFYRTVASEPSPVRSDASARALLGILRAIRNTEARVDE